MQPLECSDDFEAIAYFAERIGKSLCPIGTCERGEYLSIVVANDGTTYLLLYDELKGLGFNVRDAIDSLIGGPRTSEIEAMKSLGTWKMDRPAT